MNNKRTILFFILFLLLITAVIYVSKIDVDLYFRTKYITSERKLLNKLSTIDQLEDYYYSNNTIDNRDNKSPVVRACYFKLYKKYMEKGLKNKAFLLTKNRFEENEKDVKVASNYLYHLRKKERSRERDSIFQHIMTKFYDDATIHKMYLEYLEEDTSLLQKIKSSFNKQLSRRDFKLILKPSNQEIYPDFFQTKGEERLIYFTVDDEKIEEVQFFHQKENVEEPSLLISSSNVIDSNVELEFKKSSEGNIFSTKLNPSIGEIENMCVKYRYEEE